MLLVNGKLNPRAHRIFSDQAHEANREVLEHSERVASGITYARAKRPDRQWGRPVGWAESDTELLSKARHRDVATLCGVSKTTGQKVRQALRRLGANASKPISLSARGETVA